MEISELREIRSARAPPYGVIKIMTTVCYLLGMPLHHAQRWPCVKDIINHTDVFQQLFEGFDPKQLTLDQLAFARATLKEFSLEKITAVSQACGSAYRWIEWVVKEGYS